jgi:predicted aldo/keto reductase-like oxidoreductase
MLERKFGNHQDTISAVGFGGIIVKDETQDSANNIVAKAYDRGITYYDVAPTYGNAQERLGPALKPYRNKVFLACKTEKRDAEGASRHLEESRKLLQTDHFDLYQFHAVTTSDDVEEIFAPGGAMETVRKAREQGLVRYIGFSAHDEQAALAMLERYPFDSVLFPFNFATWYKGKFGPTLFSQARELGIGILALKSLAKRPWGENEKRTWSKTWYHPVETYDEADLALRFTLSLPVTAAVSPGHQEFLWWMCDIAENNRPLTEDEKRQLKRKSQELAPIFPK